MDIRIRWFDCPAIDGGGTRLVATANSETVFEKQYQPEELDNAIRDIIGTICPKLMEENQRFFNVQPERRPKV